MALTFRSPPLPMAEIISHNHHHHHHLLHSSLISSRSRHRALTIRSQKPTSDSDNIQQETSSIASPPPTKPSAASSGLGFGSSTSSSSSATKSDANKKKKKNSKSSSREREKASVIRRVPVEKAALVSEEDKARAEEQRKNESAFLLAWLGLGGIILLQGILLAASGFLPEQWDQFLVKYLYPSFTPTVVLFVAGTVTYGVLKYLQNDSLKNVK